MEGADIRKTIVGLSYPQAIDVGDGFVRRHWLIKTANELPESAELLRLQAAVQRELVGRIDAAYANQVAADELAAAAPRLLLVAISAFHLVVRVDYAGPDREVGDSAAIAQWGALQLIGKALRITDLQGLPVEYWFFMNEP